jgi:flagellar biosynthesis GTPase FlhF
MRGIFISYRREDAEGQAGRLFDDLSAHFGRDAVFMDVAGIKKGLDFRRIIDEHVASCGVLLVLIGKRWLSATDSKGKRRLDDANDFVRLETAAALSRDIPVVPVLVQDAVMPTEQDLPDVLKELAFRNGTELTHARWDSDVKLLIEDLRPYLETPTTAALAQPTRDQSPVATARGTSPWSRRPTSRSLWAAGGAVVVFGGVAIFGYQLWQDRPTVQGPTLAAVQDRTLAAVQAPPATEAQRRPDNTAATTLVAAKPALKAADEPSKLDPTAAEAEAAKAASAKAAAAKAVAAKAAAEAAAARAAAARKDADERRRREEAERSGQLAEEQRKRDEAARQIALAQAEKNRIAAEQAAAAKVFTDIAAAVLGSRQNNRR